MLQGLFWVSTKTKFSVSSFSVCQVSKSLSYVCRIYFPCFTIGQTLTMDECLMNCRKTHLYLKREPILMNPERAELFWTGPRRRKKAWCSMAHFHRCLQAFGWSMRKTNVCSCSFPYGRVQNVRAMYLIHPLV